MQQKSLLRFSAVFFLSLAGLHCGGDKTPPKVDLFKEVPECKPDTLKVEVMKGDRQVLLTNLEIGRFNEGFDMNGDGKPDNQLAALGAIAKPALKDAFDFQKEIIIPIEFFGYTGGDSQCTKFAFYLGRWKEDRDQDGRDTSWEVNKGDCDDTDKTVQPRRQEMGKKSQDVIGNRMDDDCDGHADNETQGIDATDKMDLDGDGQSIADADCDDRKGNAVAKLRKKGAPEICNNGIDDDCDGLPDNSPMCDPYGPNSKVAVHVTTASFKENTMTPLIVFPNGVVKNGVLNAGPNLFRLNIPFDSDIHLDLTLTGARIKFNVKDSGGNTTINGGILGGVLSASSLAQIHVDAGGVLKKEQSLLDGVFVGAAGTILGLETDKDRHFLPDIDVDGDGFETFWQDGPPTPLVDGGTPLAIVDTCRDGDGTIVKNNFDGKGTLCALAKDSKGNYRFVDGLSVALKFNAVPVKLTDIVAK